MERFRRIPIFVWFLLVAVVILVGGVWFFSTVGNDTNKEDDELAIIKVSKPVSGTVEFKILGRKHIASGVPVTTYNSNPPNSGDHWAAPAKNGIYDKQLPDEQLVHNLEHGYIWISYNPYKLGIKSSEATPSAGLSKKQGEEVVKKLKEIVGGDNWKMILEPREQNDSTIALASWGRVLKLNSADYDKIKDFITTYRNRGPEKTPE